MQHLTIFTKLLTLLFIILLAAAGCKKDSDPVQPEKPETDTLNITDLKALDSDTLKVNNFKV